MTRGIFKQLLKEYRRSMSPAKRRATYNKRIVWRYPHASERQLYAIIHKVFKWFATRVVTYVKRREANYPAHTVRRDSFQSDIVLAIDAIVAEYMEKEFSYTFNLGPLLERIMEKIKSFNEGELEAYLATRLGRPLTFTEEWWGTVRQNWIVELNNRMRGTTEAYLDKVQDIVFEYTRNEIPFDNLVARIMAVSDSFSTNYANFLARDLTGTLNSMITKELQTGIGINNYYWQTAADERVRGRPGGRYPNAIPSHWEMDAKVCNWQDVSKYSADYGKTWQPRNSIMPFTHPGLAWQCRCIAAPFDIDILKEVDAELAGR